MKFKRILAIFLILMLLFTTACESRRDKPSISQQSESQEHTPYMQEVTSASETDSQTEEQTDKQTEAASTEPQGSDSATETDAQTTEQTNEQTETTSTEPQETDCETTFSMPILGFSLPQYGYYYYDLTNVVLYLDLYGELPPNYITKAEAQALGWQGGPVEDYLEGGAIGGDYFGNYDGLLPTARGRIYTECDIDTDLSRYRGSKRLVFSNDGLYFYTSDHYASFSQVIVTEDYEVLW